ncbi:MAG TPA: D-Ala-D-Ala carboxypeptidase family metallohydrolase [Chitinophagales bacterium]|nr:D-Ala-D-Ala carboxypeptidase family metallohydrolase [Chitinophagales bacterium]
MPTPLSPHFSLEEMLMSQTATRMGFTEQFNPPQDVIDNLTTLCNKVLEPLRAAISKKMGKDTPVIVTSGYRCLRTNRAIGGADNSQHTRGQAADTHVPGMSIEDWYQFIRSSGIAYDQLIQEFGQWAHISYKADAVERMECLRATTESGHTVYSMDNEPLMA